MRWQRSSGLNLSLALSAVFIACGQWTRTMRRHRASSKNGSFFVSEFGVSLLILKKLIVQEVQYIILFWIFRVFTA